MDIFERVKKQKGNIGQYAKQAHGYFAFPKLPWYPKFNRKASGFFRKSANCDSRYSWREVGILVITEGVFGMAGDLGKLDEIVKLKDKFNFRLLVDDAHGFGTMGPTGAGKPWNWCCRY